MEFSIKDQNLYWTFLVFTLIVLYQWRQQHFLPKAIPCVGESKSPFSRHFVRLKVLLRGRALLEESYYKVSKAAPVTQLVIDGRQTV